MTRLAIALWLIGPLPSRAASISASERILEIGRDPLFKVAYPQQTDWVQTGPSVEPVNRYLDSDIQSLSWRNALARLRGGYYGVAMVPAIKASTPTDVRRSRAFARQLLTVAGSHPFVARIPSAITGLGRLRYFVRDISDYPHIGATDAALFPESTLYAKREVLRERLGQPAHSGRGGIVTYLPMPFQIERYRQWMRTEPEKTIDVFFAGKLHSRHRLIARQAAEQLARRGFRVDIPAERLTYIEYLERLSRSWLVLSPKGHGEHCYRHYEALLMGSVPVINFPDLSIHYSLEDRKTAIFYRSSVEDLLATSETALADPALLRSIAAAGRSLVENEHDISQICKDLLDRLFNEEA